MSYKIDTACYCVTGKVRKNNEDNFYFDRNFLSPINQGLKEPIQSVKHASDNVILSVFDGMGGENFGEYASYAAASCLNENLSLLLHQHAGMQLLIDMSNLLNKAVLNEQSKKNTSHMGTTMASIFIEDDYIYSCNLGDSRIYRFTNGKLIQMSKDHIMKASENEAKSPLLQYLGMDSDEYTLEPCIEKEKLISGDKYILCSDGITDMLDDNEISDIIAHSSNARDCVDSLIKKALEKGGKDNATAISCFISPDNSISRTIAVNSFLFYFLCSFAFVMTAATIILVSKVVKLNAENTILSSPSEKPIVTITPAIESEEIREINDVEKEKKEKTPRPSPTGTETQIFKPIITPAIDTEDHNLQDENNYIPFSPQTVPPIMKWLKMHQRDFSLIRSPLFKNGIPISLPDGKDPFTHPTAHPLLNDRAEEENY